MTGAELLRESGSIIMTIDAPEGMDSDELDTRLAAWLEAQEDKLAAYRWVCARIDSEVALLKGVVDRVQGRARTLDRNKERIRSMATALLVDREILTGSAETVKGVDYSAWLAKSERVEVAIDPRKLPVKFRKISVSADLTLIKEQLKTKKVKGCQLVVSRTVRFR